jgi:hypothetical protein
MPAICLTRQDLHRAGHGRLLANSGSNGEVTLSLARHGSADFQVLPETAVTVAEITRTSAVRAESLR